MELAELEEKLTQSTVDPDKLMEIESSKSSVETEEKDNNPRKVW